MEWRSIDDALEPPRYWAAGASGFYRHDIAGAVTGEPIGWRKLKRLRTAGEQIAACDEFAAAVSLRLPPGATWTYMPSSMRHHCGSVPDSIEPRFRAALESLRGDLNFVEPLVRATPVDSVHESRDRDIARLTATLASTDGAERLRGQVYVVDNFVNTGATFEAFRRALRRNAITFEPTLLAWVFTGNSRRIR